MQDLVENFLFLHMKGLNLKLTTQPDINIYVEKKDYQYHMCINYKEIEAIGLNNDELICLLFHEKGHIELNHLENPNNPYIMVMLSFLLMLPVLPWVTAIIWLDFKAIFFIIYGLFLCLINFIMIKDLKQIRNNELKADEYAIKNTSVLVFINLMKKLSNFYNTRNYRNFLSSHPTCAERIKNAHSLIIDP